VVPRKVLPTLEEQDYSKRESEYFERQGRLKAEGDSLEIFYTSDLYRNSRPGTYQDQFLERTFHLNRLDVSWS
jgi:hypothetical protein